MRSEAHPPYIIYLFMVSFRHHGYYCGPGWSDGKWQGSVRYGKKRPMDSYDATCKEHDAAYSRKGTDLAAADFKFFKQNFRARHPDPVVQKKRNYASVGVGLQGVARYLGLAERINTYDSNGIVYCLSYFRNNGKRSFKIC